jgi:EAL domain-containing protein (putative c-di-GMP-specific phosphodiesterase class I)
VVAEGVETEGQRAFLMRNGCGAFQGYLFSRPIPAVALLTWIEAQSLRVNHKYRLPLIQLI